MASRVGHGGGGHRHGTVGHGGREHHHRDGAGVCGARPRPARPGDAGMSAEADSVVAAPARTVAVAWRPELCTLCEACLDACPSGAITLRDAAEVDAGLCTACGACEAACRNGVFTRPEA